MPEEPEELIERGQDPGAIQKERDPALDLLDNIQAETVFLDPENADLYPVERNDMDPELERCADKDLMNEILAEPEESTPAAAELPMPTSLSIALMQPGCPWNALFRFVVQLRSVSGGCDQRWIPNAMNVRRKSTDQNLNWHQFLEQNLCILMYTYVYLCILMISYHYFCILYTYACLCFNMFYIVLLFIHIYPSSIFCCYFLHIVANICKYAYNKKYIATVHLRVQIHDVEILLCLCIL